MCASQKVRTLAHILTVRNKHEKLEGNGEAGFDTPFMIQSHTESMKEIEGAL